MPRRVLFILVVLLLGSTAVLRAQDSARVLIVSTRVGESITRYQRDRYALFRGMTDFASATFYLLPDGRCAGRVARNTGTGTTDTLVWYSERAISTISEQIDHIEALADSRYVMGSSPAALRAGRAVPLTEIGSATELAPRPGQPVLPPVERVPQDGSIWRKETPMTIPFALMRGKADCVVARICDTLDVYGWRYYHLVPALQGVTGASFARTADGAVLRVSTERGDTAIALSGNELRLLVRYIGAYERAMRLYDGDSAHTPENFVRLGHASTVRPLFDRGLLGLRASGYRSPERVTATTIFGDVTTGPLFFSSSEAVYLGVQNDEWDAVDTSGFIVRLRMDQLSDIRPEEGSRFVGGFFTGWLASAAILSMYAPFEVGSHNGGEEFTDGGEAAFTGLLMGLPFGVAAGAIAAIIPSPEYPEEADSSITFRGLSPALRAMQAFRSFPPPELRALMSGSERRQLDSIAAMQLTATGGLERDGIAAEEQSPGQETSRAANGCRVQLALNYGMHLYQARNTDIPDDGRHARNWLGADIAFILPLIAFSDNGAGVSLHPYAGGGWNTMRAGMDLALNTSSSFYLTAGMEYQSITENDFGHFNFYFNDVLEQTTLRDHLFATIGAGLRWTSTFLEVRMCFGLGTPLYTTGPQVLDPWWPRSPMPNIRGFNTFLIRLGWEWPLD
ncbi:MAG: hypothetical protein IPP94_18765 [Ignavibacteria bacterium]|nr:hypothetical protein [Ignavibacteria bacterium]